jgi:pyruvate/2-oxoglutarate dehydrogenase complex dihydrolipoamide acyltransferase (E2) component
MPNKNKMKSLNLSGSQAEIVVKSLNERLYEFDEELDALESRIIEIRMKKSQLNNLLAELGGAPVGEDAPKKRGRKPGSGKKAAAVSTNAAPAVKGKRGRKPGSGKKAAAVANAAPAVKGKRGRKPGSGKKAAAVANAAPAVKGKRGRKPGSGKKAAAVVAPKVAAKTEAPKATVVAAKGKRGRKAGAGKKAAAVVAPKVAAKTEAPAKAAVKAAAPKAAKAAAPKKAAKTDVAAKRGRKTGGENTLASKIVSSIQDAKKGLSTREIVDAINTRYGAEKDERKLIQAVSSTLISLTKRGKIKRENGNDGQILNIVVS